MIRYVYGPMGSGKSAALVAAAEQEPDRRHWIAFAPACDTVNGATIHTRKDGGRSIEAIPIADSFDLFRRVRAARETGRLAPSGGAVLIDEAHRICRQHDHREARALIAVCLGLDAMGFSVVMAGLDTGHHGHHLEPYATIMGDKELIKEFALHRPGGGYCHYCGPGARSAYSWMVVDREQPIAGKLGEDYLAVCRDCFWDLMRRRVRERELQAREAST